MEKVANKIASAKQVKEYYLEHLTPSASESEPISDGLVDHSCTINNRMLSIPEIRGMLLIAEELPPKTNPLEGTSKLQHVISKARTPKRIETAVEMILDHRRGGIMPNQPPVSAFAGTASGAGGKGLVELVIHKHETAQYLVTVKLQSLSVDAHVKVVMPEVFSSCAAYRQKCGYPGDAQYGQLSWRAGWSKGAEAFYTLVEAVKHDTVFDGHLKEALKANQTPQETVDQKLQEQIANIQRLIDEETQVNNDIEIVEDDQQMDDDQQKDDQQGGGAAGAGQSGDKIVEETPLSRFLQVDDDEVTVAAARLVSTHVDIIVDTGGNAQLVAEQIHSTQAGKYVCKEHGQDKKGFVLLPFDSTCIGQASSHPHLRKPVLQQPVIERCQKIGLLVRAKAHTNSFDVTTLQPDDLWIVFDGGRTGYTDAKLWGGLKNSTSGQPLKKTKGSLTITYDEDAVADNVGRYSATGSMPNVEVAHFASLDELNLPKRKRLHSSGSNLSNCIGPIVLTPWANENKTWHLSKKSKIAVLGRFIIPTGNGLDSEASVIDSADKFKNLPTEPVFFHTKPIDLADDMIHSYFGRAVIDFSVAQGVWALASIRRRIPYVGVVGSEMHRNELQKWLVQYLKRALLDKDDPLYDKALDDAQQGSSGKKDPPPPAGTPKAKAKGKSEKKDSGQGAKNDTKEQLLNKLKDLMAKNKGAGASGEEPDEDEDDPGDE